MSEDDTPEKDDQYVDFADAKRMLEDHVDLMHKEHHSHAKLYKPQFRAKDGTLYVKHQIESESITKGQVLDIVDMFFEWYPGGSSFAEKALWKSMDRYNLMHTAKDREGNLEKKTRIGPAYSSGATIMSNGKASRMGPNVTIEFETQPHFDKRDMVVNKLLYDILLKKEEAEMTDLAKMRELGCIVYDDLSAYDWDFLAGYYETKREVYNQIVLPNKNKELFTKLYAKTRSRPEQTGYNCFMFSGTYGVGKTEMAKVVANILGYNFVEMPLEAVMTKWYGEAEKQLGRVFDAARGLGPTVLFLDEIDCLAGDRDGGMHEATKRIMSVLMTNTAKTRMDGDLVVVAATNKPDTIDGGLMRRFKKHLKFPLPEHDDLVAIYNHYAKQLDEITLEELARMSKGFSPFDVLSACAAAEDKYMDDMLEKENPHVISPPEHYYLKGVEKIRKINDPDKKKIGFGG
ncbi:MAG: ATP-binding protein [Candidatus Woesearchaeota archaeon]